MYSVGRVATDKFGCRVIRRPFVGVLSNEDAVLRVAGSAKTVSSMIDVLDTHAFAKNQVEDTRQHARNNFSCHGRTHFQRQCNFTDRHPCFSVDPFDHNAASASAVVFEASVPDASYRFPCCGIISFVDDYFPPSFHFSVFLKAQGGIVHACSSGFCLRVLIILLILRFCPSTGGSCDSLHLLCCEGSHLESFGCRKPTQCCGTSKDGGDD